MGLVISFILGLCILGYLKATEQPDTYMRHPSPQEPPVIKRKEEVEVTYKETNKPSRNKKLGGESLEFEEV